MRFLLLTILFTIGLSFGLNKLFIQFKKYLEPDTYEISYFQNLGIKTIDGLNSAKEAKKKKLLWVAGPNYKGGAAFSPSENSVLVQELLIGYDQVWGNKKFLKSYFKQEFDTSITPTSINTSSFETNYVYLSWAGGLKILQTFGTNILILGSSEVERAIIPAMIKESIAENRSDLKILPATVGGLPLKALRKYVDHIAVDKEIEQVIWGISLWQMSDTSSEIYKEKDERQLAKIKSEEDPRSTLSYLDEGLGLDSYFPEKFDFNILLDFNFEDISNIYKASKKKLKNDEIKEGFYFPKEFLQNNKMLDEQAKSVQPYFSRVSRLKPDDCNTALSEQEILKILNTLKKKSKSIYIYLTPVTPLLTNAVPLCMRKKAVSFINSLASEQVHVLVKEWNEWGLDWTDFSYNMKTMNEAFLDPNHVNPKGALKISSLIGKWVVQEEIK